jgi:hypothetical protein
VRIRSRRKLEFRSHQNHLFDHTKEHVEQEIIRVISCAQALGGGPGSFVPLSDLSLGLITRLTCKTTIFYVCYVRIFQIYDVSDSIRNVLNPSIFNYYYIVSHNILVLCSSILMIRYVRYRWWHWQESRCVHHRYFDR